MVTFVSMICLFISLCLMALLCGSELFFSMSLLCPIAGGYLSVPTSHQVILPHISTQNSVKLQTESHRTKHCLKAAILYTTGVVIQSPKCLAARRRPAVSLWMHVGVAASHKEDSKPQGLVGSRRALKFCLNSHSLGNQAWLLSPPTPIMLGKQEVYPLLSPALWST